MLFFNKKKEEKKEDNELKKILGILQREPEIKLTVKSVVMYEALSKKKFSAVEMTSEDALMLMYCAFVCSTGLEIDLETFGLMLENKDLATRLNKDLTRLERFTLQFTKGDEEEQKEEKKEEENVEFSITDMVDSLIFKYGVSADYVMNRMELWELNHFFEGAEERYKEDMEEKRLWTFLQVAPQIDLKKCKNPDQFFPLPWTEQRRKEELQKKLDKEAEAAKNILGKELKIDLRGI